MMLKQGMSSFVNMTSSFCIIHGVEVNTCNILRNKVDNLVKNGRLSKLIGTVVGLLNIRMVGEASKTGTLELLQKARGQKKAIKAAFDELIKAGYNGGHITIAHRNNEKFIEQFSELVREKFARAMIEVLPTSGLCSFYAEEGGLLMGYEI